MIFYVSDNTFIVFMVTSKGNNGSLISYKISKMVSYIFLFVLLPICMSVD